MDNPFAAAPTPPKLSSRIRPCYRISALCLPASGPSWKSLVVSVSLDRCRLVWLSEQDRPPISRLEFRNYKGEVVEVAAEAISTEHSGTVWIVDCRLGRPLTVTDLAQLL
jgi:hypothetical protein